MTPTPAVAIVGGGPTGLALALTLARLGVASTVLEHRTAPTPLNESRAITWMPGGLNFLDWTGIMDAFEEVGMHRTGHEFWSTSRRLLVVRYDRLPHPHPYTIIIPQHHSERLLAQAAQATGLVQLRRGHRVVDASSIGDEAVLTVAGPDTDYQLRAAWAVAADGARSTVRRALGIAQRWRDYGMDSAVADVQMDYGQPRERSRIVLDPRRPWGLFAFAPDRWRLVYRLNPGEDRDAMTTAAAAASMLRDKVADVPAHRFLWASAFRLGQGQSETYRQGRWLLVGDAAHAMGPSAGAGMMIGVLGAWRLGVALAATLRTGSEEPLVAAARKQRVASQRVQHDNARIFANMALRSTPLAAVRAIALLGLGQIPAIANRMARSEALLHLPPVSAAPPNRQEGAPGIAPA